MAIKDILKDKKIFYTLIGTALIISVVTVYFIKFHSWNKKEEQIIEVPLFTKDEEIINITVYFPSDDDKQDIITESREIYKTKALVNQAKQTILKLLEGPNNNTATPVVPTGTRLRELFIEEGHAYVDFSKELSENHPGGSNAEMDTISCIVNTLLKNFKDIKDVQFLIEGKTQSTLAGHIDISQPFKENPETKNKDSEEE